MKKMMFGNTVMLLGLALFCMSALGTLPGVVSWVSFVFIAAGFIMAVDGFFSSDK